ncbi:hypothetical protein [Reichenbachiella versicolor]|uniref:hypothetical protein n=1 Tax=Reichenbachiella versicolor TaxID=1821036 RepID=UPI000D6E6ED5|nr:hypothetical protein [Reichenbachiella versicolor]
MKLIRLTGIATIILSSFSGLAQNTSSPYTAIGIGEIHERTTSHQAGMGDVGIGMPQPLSINTLNPANLVLHSFSIFELAIQAESRNLSSAQGSSSTGSSGYKYLSFAFPIIPYKWTTSLSMNPYSSVNYNLTTSAPVEGSEDEADISLVGSGGLSEFRFSNGFKLTEELSIGLRTSFLFGFTEHTNDYFLKGDGFSQIRNVYTETTNYKGFDYGVGVSYRKTFENKKLLFLGATYDLANDLSGSRDVVFSSGTFGDISDPFADRSIDDHFSLPSKIGIGLGLIKENHYSLGVDVTWSDWDQNPDLSSNQNSEYKDSFTAGVGFEYVPEYDDVDNYLARVRYRIGFKYEQLPYLFNGKQINDFGINFGWSLPVRGVSSLNMAFKYGGRGTTKNDLVRENYFKFTLGATLNDRWFVRRKYN